ncbi:MULTISPECIES: hypothetical protein [Xanthomonas]|uniref:Uncharacterized protein n=1 Tax=Xanthomonas hortorum pv. gardneri TaxID=2754056 RepID=A0A6V7FLV6_9XANT|nr:MULTISPECIES: hypothetical protein [Xanthomonas]APO97862.1 hypothetical protein BJD13_01350 [Xanthomonas perforans]APP82787.1 hypothetical protein BJD10_24215 [Xanthomonas hortorum pv. gardneri]KLA99329.1 hypothetical protein SM19410_06950 [Xanthomonas hortorum pv. gardneri]KLB02808.1 hypothetical protein SM17710_02610 [Xanthomonas hortorum pv. gardneri]KLB06107.1 hypothetical protein SM18210_02090 [Xanthomonas hortorum pv. gardneri]
MKAISMFGLLAFAATYSMTAQAQAHYEGSHARDIDITYKVGEHNSVVGEVTNNTQNAVYIAADFKGYTADGHVSQGGAVVIFDHLEPGESARFKGGGFSETITTAKLVMLRTVP